MAQGLSVLLSPAVAFGTIIDRALHAIIPPSATKAEERETSAEQFREVVAAEADVSSAEEELIHGVFSLGETEVQEVMVPRVDIVGIDASTPWSEVFDRIRSSEHARFPVFRDTLDEVTGILYAKDVLPAIVADEEPAAGWLSLVRPSAFIPVSKRIDAQLREFQASRTHIAIVSDEYGGTAGLVTIEDILEVIVGEIRDEYDVEEPQIQQEGSARYWVSGGLPVDELSERLNVDFGVEDVTTVGGLVYALFGRVPRSGESIVALRIPHRRRTRAPAPHRARVLRAVGSRRGVGARLIMLSLPLDHFADRRRVADGRRHGGSLGEPHLVAPLGRASAARRRGGSDLSRAAAPAAHGRQRRRRDDAARRRNGRRNGRGNEDPVGIAHPRRCGRACSGS